MFNLEIDKEDKELKELKELKDFKELKELDTEIRETVNRVPLTVEQLPDKVLFKVEWVNENEDLLKEWAEKGRYYAWMHNKASNDYSRLNNALTMPLIIVSTLTGSASFSQVGTHKTSFFLTTIFPFVIGAMSISTALLSSLTKFLKTSELTEKHNMFYRQYNILVRNICLELSLPPSQRKNPADTLNINRHEFDRLVNEAPNIPEHVIIEFNKKFPCKKNKPEIASSFEKITIFGRHKHLKEKEDTFRKIRNFYRWRAVKVFEDKIDKERKNDLREFRKSHSTRNSFCDSYTNQEHLNLKKKEDTLEEIYDSYEDKPMFKSRLGRLNIFSNKKNDDENIDNDVVVDIKD